MRVLVNALSARLGGGQTYVMNLVRFLPEGVPVEIFIVAPDSLNLPVNRKNIKRIAVRWPVGNPIMRAVWERLCLPKLARQIKADVFYAPGGLIGASMPNGCKNVTMFRNMLPFSTEHGKYPLGYMRLRHWILKRLMLRSMRRADLVIFISQYAKGIIEQQIRGGLKRTAIIPHGIGPEFRVPATGNSLPTDGSQGGPYILYVSNLDFYKSQLEVTRAYALLKQRRKTTEKLVFVGTESPQYGRMVRREIQRLGLGDDVLIKGQVPYAEMPLLYQHAVVNLFASKCENCPNILLEAMAAGRPVVVSNLPPMPEFAGEAAVYFDPARPEELAKQLACILSDPAQHTELAEKARERSLLFDWESVACETWRAIESIT
jgi:glycosyltransferase involved in cell wall biosynthesis